MKHTRSIVSSFLGFLLLMSFSGFPVQQAMADSSVTVKNETGYDLSEIKYVQEIGKTNSLVGRAQQIRNGNSCTFSLKKEGFYRVYAALIMGGKKTYAKGNANKLQDGGRYILTLTEVIVNKEGTNLNFIDQSEFDAIK
jgi:hypothetical protein